MRGRVRVLSGENWTRVADENRRGKGGFAHPRSQHRRDAEAAAILFASRIARCSSGRVVTAMSAMTATTRAAAITVLALGACRKDATPQPNATADRGPIIDSHTLITPLDESIDTALELFRRVGVVKFCNKNGGALGSRAFAATLQVKHRLKDKFEFFVNVSWDGVSEPGWGEAEAERFRREVGYGAKGVKFFKAMGLGARDTKGRLIPVDDPIDPIMEQAAKLNAVVAIHVGDPRPSSSRPRRRTSAMTSKVGARLELLRATTPP